MAATTVQTALSLTDHEFLQRLHRLGTATIHDLCAAVGVTATAVRQRLARLEAAGLVRKAVERHGRGRPSHQYSLTELAARRLGDNYADLAVLLWQVLTDIEDEGLRTSMRQRLQRALVGTYGVGVTGASVPERLRQLHDVLRRRGFDVELDTADRPGALPILRENNCPYHELASRDATICGLEQAVFSEVLGERVELAACCQNGHHCCEFVVHDRADS